jgi:hypothetical protein
MSLMYDYFSIIFKSAAEEKQPDVWHVWPPNVEH